MVVYSRTSEMGGRREGMNATLFKGRQKCLSLFKVVSFLFLKLHLSTSLPLSLSFFWHFLYFFSFIGLCQSLHPHSLYFHQFLFTLHCECLICLSSLSLLHLPLLQALQLLTSPVSSLESTTTNVRVFSLPFVPAVGPRVHVSPNGVLFEMNSVYSGQGIPWEYGPPAISP